MIASLAAGLFAPYILAAEPHSNYTIVFQFPLPLKGRKLCLCLEKLWLKTNFIIIKLSSRAEFLVFDNFNIHFL